MKDECPRRAWLVSKMGRLTAGVQYEPECKPLMCLLITGTFGPERLNEVLLSSFDVAYLYVKGS